MAKDPREILSDLQRGYKEFYGAHKECLPAFKKLSEVAMGPGVLDRKTKELIAAAIGLSMRCEYCIVHHVYESLKAGATRDELIETACVTTLMGGGPTVTYSSTLFQDSINTFAPDFGK